MLTLQSPAPDRALLTLAELREAVGLDEADGSRDASLIRLGAAVADTIARTCGVAPAGNAIPTLRAETVTETLRLRFCRSSLLLSRLPVGTISSVSIDGVEADASTYEAEAASGLLHRLAGACRVEWNPGTVVVTYVGGWAVVPSDLSRAAAKLAKSFWAEQRRSDPSLRSREIPGVITETWWVGPSSDPAVPQDVRDLLADYMQYSIG